jgi:putative acetyltransferase
VGIAFMEFTMDAYHGVYNLWRQSKGIGLSDGDSRESIRRYLARNPKMSFVAKAEGRVVGAVLCGHDGRRGYIHHLAVHPNYQRQGIGHTLVEHALQALRVAGIQKCHLFVFASNPDGIAFWEGMGWTFRREIGVMSKNLDSPT